jgi:hypothetical protein
MKGLLVVLFLIYLYLEGTYSVDIILKYGQDVTFDLESAFQLRS